MDRPRVSTCTRIRGRIGAFALMVGTQVSRAVADWRLAEDVLEQGIQNALALLGASDRR